MCEVFMSKELRFLAVLGAVSASIAAVSVVEAAPPEFCREYAAAAVRQVEAAKSTPTCDRGRGARWTVDYRVHFEWCLGAPPGVVEAERAARTNWIRSCRRM